MSVDRPENLRSSGGVDLKPPSSRDEEVSPRQLRQRNSKSNKRLRLANVEVNFEANGPATIANDGGEADEVQYKLRGTRAPTTVINIRDVCEAYSSTTALGLGL